MVINGNKAYSIAIAKEVKFALFSNNPEILTPADKKWLKSMKRKKLLQIKQAKLNLKKLTKKYTKEENFKVFLNSILKSPKVKKWKKLKTTKNLEEFKHSLWMIFCNFPSKFMKEEDRPLTFKEICAEYESFLKRYIKIISEPWMFKRLI